MKRSFREKYRGNKVPRLTKFLYPFSTLFRDACYALVGAFLLQYAMTSGVLSSDPEVFKAQYGVITVALMIALVWDGINDPIMGFIVEKCHFKSGKYKPWILLGAIGNTIAVLLMFLVRPTFADGSANGWAYVVCMIGFYFLWDAFFTMNDIGYWAMLPSLSNNDQERASLTSRVTLCSSIGGFAMTAAAMLLPQMFQGVSTANMYAFFAIIVSILFLASQASVFFFCQERENEGAPVEEEKSSLLDLFKIFGKDKMVRPTVIALFLYYLGSGVLTGGIGLNYFYLSLGYGSGRGGLVATVVSVMYVVGMIAAQSTYPLLAKKISKKRILDISFLIQIIGFLGFLVCCVPLFGNNPIAFSNAPLPEMSSMDFGWAFGGLMFLNYLFPFVFFFGMGWMYMAILVMFQDSIDYHEYAFGERKESLISSWRPLTVKLGSALLRGFQYLIFIVAGVYAAYSKISAAESEYNIVTSTGGGGAGTQEYQNYINAIAEAEAMVGADNMRIFGILVVVLLTLAISGAYVSLRLFYRENEGDHERVVEALNARKNS